MHDLAKAYGELMTVSEFYNTLKDAETQNEDTKECITMLFRLHALHRIQ